MTTQLDKAIATTIERGKTLFLDGYEIHPDTDRIGVYIVQTPERCKSGFTYRNLYEVDLANGTCDCEMFQRSAGRDGQENGRCKHLDATTEAVTKAALLVAPLFAGKNALAARESPSVVKGKSAGGYASLYHAPTKGEIARANSTTIQPDGSRVDTMTGEVLAEAVRVLPVYGSEAWRKQKDEDFGE